MSQPIPGKNYRHKTFMFHPSLNGGWFCKKGRAEVFLSVGSNGYFCRYVYSVSNLNSFWGKGQDHNPEKAILKAYNDFLDNLRK